MNGLGERRDVVELTLAIELYREVLDAVTDAAELSAIEEFVS